MTDPYRQAAYRCIRCENAPLRELMGGRLVCETCGGVLMEEADLFEAIGDLSSEVPQLVDDGEIQRACPRCERRLVGCALVIGRETYDDVVRCDAHGVWIDAAQMLALFERLSRSSHAGAARGRSYGGVGEVLIVHGRRPRSRPRAPLYGTQHATLPCPVCAGAALGFGGGKWSCARCRGVFVEDAALATMIAEMTGAPWQPPAPTSTIEGSRPCPVCSAGMIEEEMLSVLIERCPGHGVWFDGDELAAALLRSLP